MSCDDSVARAPRIVRPHGTGERAGVRRWVMRAAHMWRTWNAKSRPERRHRHSQPHSERGPRALQEGAFSARLLKRENYKYRGGKPLDLNRL